MNPGSEIVSTLDSDKITSILTAFFKFTANFVVSRCDVYKLQRGFGFSLFRQSF